MLEEGMIYRAGKNFYKSTVEKILKNEFYTGVFYWKGKRYENAQHEPIISKELFRKVQIVHAKPGKSKSRKDLFPYTNLITCGVCGCSVSAQIQKGRYIYYHCSGNKGNCNQPYVKQEVLDVRFEQLLENIVIPEDIQKLILDSLRASLKDKIEYHNACVQKIQAQVKILQHRIDQAYLDKVDNKISEDFWKTQTKKWIDEKEELSIKLLGYQKADTNYLENANLIFELANKAAGLFKRANVDQKRRLVNMIVSNSILKDGNIDLELRSPFDKVLETSKTGNWRPQGDSNPRFRRERAMS